MMLRLLALCALVALTASACDSAGDEIQPLGGILYVSLEGASSLRLESGFNLPCGPRIVTERQLLAGRFKVNVRGTEAVSGTCTSPEPVVTTIPIETGGAATVPVDIQFGGFIDEYSYVRGPQGARLDSVSTANTRPGPRPR